ncbi:MAG: AEC family transporter [Candidatus Hadarchaeota archaeon]
MPLLYIFSFVILGMALRIISAHFRLGIFNMAFKFLNNFAIWVILPVVVFISTARYTSGQILGFGNALLLGFIGAGVCFVSAVVISNMAREDKKTTVAMTLNSTFMNTTYLGFPTVYVLLGSAALGPAALYAIGIGTLHIIFGTAMASLISKRRLTSRDVAMTVLTFPAVFALIAALVFVAFQAPLPDIVKNTFDTYLAMPFFALMLLLVGYQIPLVNPRRYFGQLATVGSLRFLVCPLVSYLFILILGLNLRTDLSPRPALLLSAMPPAVFNIILAHNFKLDMKLYGALVFYLTLAFLFVALPLLYSTMLI